MARILQQVERRPDDRPLHRDVVWLAAGVAEREIREDKPGHAAVLDDVASGTHDYGRDAVGLDVAGDEAHGLVAARSDRHQHNGVHTVLATPFEESRSVILHMGTVVAGGERADAAFCMELGQAVDREI